MPDCESLKGRDGETHHVTLMGRSRQAALRPRRSVRGAEGRWQEPVPPNAEVVVVCRGPDGAQLAGAARTSHCRPRGLDDRAVISHRPGAGSLRWKGHQGWFLPRPLSSACTCRLHVVFRVRVLVLTSSSCTDTSLIGPVPCAHYDFMLTQLCLSRPCLQNTF